MKKLWCAIVILFVIGMFPAAHVSAAKYPAKYRNENVSSVKNQGDQGLCWSFASVAAMEAELIQNNGEGNDIDLSELQLAYFSRNPAMDELGQMNVIYSGEYDYLEGATENFLALALIAGVSPVEEDSLPFSYEDATGRKTLDASYAYTGKYYLNEFKLMRELTRDEIKAAIKEYGGVAIGFDANTWNYNEETHAWYNPDSERVNHSVCIVGWDDNYSKKNFNTKPEGNGAWIVKNSWGEEWGDGGYFYLSYYDSTYNLGTYAVFDMEPGKYSDHIYQNAVCATEYFSFDENGTAFFMNGAKGYERVANVFTACANDDGGELLKAVSFYTYVEGDYTVWIYKNVKESNKPESGTLVATLKGNMEKPGHKIIPLKSPVYLSEGESYSVVVSAVDKNGEYIGVATSGHDTYRLHTYGQSYASSSKDHWFDYAVSYGENLFINAYTDNVKRDAKADKEKVTMVTNLKEAEQIELPQTVTGIKVGHTESTSVTLSWDKKEDADYVIYQYNPTAKTWKKVGYSSQNFYKINGLKAGTSYTFGVKEAVKGNVRSTSAMHYIQGLEYAEVTAKTTSSKQITPTVTVSESGNTVKWSKVSGANKYVVYVLSPTTDYIWKKLKTVKSGSSLKYTDKNVVPGLTYMYRVYSYKDSERLSRGVPVTVIYE